MNFNWSLLSSMAFRLVSWRRRRREARELEAAEMAARRSLLKMQDRGAIGPEVDLLAKNLPFLDARTENGQPVVTMNATVEVTPEVAGQHRGGELLN